MSTLTQLDRLRVVDIRRVEAGRNRLAWRCARCDDEHSSTESWWATFDPPGPERLTVVLCDPCWTATRARLEHEVFGYAGPVR